MNLIDATLAAIDECALDGWVDTTPLGVALHPIAYDPNHSQVSTPSEILNHILPVWGKLSSATRGLTVIAGRGDMVRLLSALPGKYTVMLPAVDGRARSLEIYVQLNSKEAVKNERARLHVRAYVRFNTGKTQPPQATRTNVSRRTPT